MHVIVQRELYIPTMRRKEMLPRVVMEHYNDASARTQSRVSIVALLHCNRVEIQWLRMWNLIQFKYKEVFQTETFQYGFGSKNHFSFRSELKIFQSPFIVLNQLSVFKQMVVKWRYKYLHFVVCYTLNITAKTVTCSTKRPFCNTSYRRRPNTHEKWKNTSVKSTMKTMMPLKSMHWKNTKNWWNSSTRREMWWHRQ